MRPDLRFCFSLSLAAAFALAATPAHAVTLTADYTYDTNHFFDAAGNPNWSQARTTLQAALTFYSNILNDTLNAITVPAAIHSSQGGNASWSWTMSFTHPGTGATQILVDQTIAANDYRIYAGGRVYGGGTLGIGGPGGAGYETHASGNFTSAEIITINSNNATFPSNVQHRGETGFSSWGGSVSFDMSSLPTWNYDYLSPPVSGTNDFYSVAIHELTHSLGFGASDEWEMMRSGLNFTGPASIAKYGAPSVPLSDAGHWAVINSPVYGGAASQEVAMSPNITVGTRKILTQLDAAALTDLGWELVAPPGVAGDYNANGVVDAADYTVWRDHNNQSFTLPNDSTPGTVNSTDYTVWKANFGKTIGSGSSEIVAGTMAAPEPTACVLVLIACAALSARRPLRP